MPKNNLVLTTQEHGVLTVTFQRPPVNAFNLQMIEELLETLKYAKREQDVRCVVMTGSGGYFCSGHDVGEISQVTDTDSYRHHLGRTYNQLVLRMRRLEKPILGAINGPAVGAGLGVALATDLRWAAESASFVFGFSAVGLTTDAGTSIMLPLLIGLSRAMEMALTNQPLDAQQALQFGLVNQVLPDETFAQAVNEVALRLAKGPTRAFGLTKRAFNHAVLPALEGSLDYEAYLQEIAHRTEDHQEGLTAFLEKRPPDFQGN
jgi:2-(1,2-epoxy-1,2-dihydrophenyl)acetyl-CoA isomerase